ncbi:ABC transporter ATP-binding protein [Allobaculum mucilyticum]|uniref:ABC transporter ATP-binding protein n=1 Tax=Allobaculum mucilyticum TaxID=2834459 RepID=UPI001E625770|nr:ABC transporter ATP-binding protein [Allobaculum mucilyticum]UNT96111.1 ABC transporter ATP-binding protein [Allobaculum mucilyticum]
MIQLEHLTRRFGQKTAVDDISVNIKDGCITGFIGPNGAGKTTTIHMMTGVLEPSEGSVLINGINLKEKPIEAKKQFALVPDSPDLFVRLSAREYVQLLCAIYETDPKRAEENLAKYARRFEIEDVLDSKMQSYSHGMRQKAIITAALCTDPDVLILDEPMTGLDPVASFQLKEIMKERAAQGKAVFFSTHVLEVAEKLCDAILIINQGKIVYEGTLDELRALHPECASLEEVFMEVVGSE